MSQQDKQTWRLKKTLSRHVDFRPIENDDIKFAFAAYRKGAFEIEPGLDAATFKVAFTESVLKRYDAAWTMFAETKLGFRPVGMAFGFWPHDQAATFMVLNTFIWFDASARNKIESAVKFISEIHLEIPMLGFAKAHDKPFFEVLARHGIVRRVGTSMNVWPGESASVWETRTI